MIVLKPGLQTTIQDLGRSGLYHLGVPPSGAADKYSFILGNILLGNPIDYAGLEFVLLGPTLEFEDTTVVTITGAPCDPTLNYHPIPMWETVKVQAGDILSVKTTSQGARSYLCVSGGIQVSESLGSRSTYLLGQLGGLSGRKLQPADRIPIAAPLPGALKRIGKRIPLDYIPAFARDNSVRAVIGISSHMVSDTGIKAFLDSDWYVSTESDRVAYRYSGSTIAVNELQPSFGGGDSSFNVVDSYYPIGGILIPNPHEIIVMHCDATSGGGFVKLGAVISSDLDIIAQSRPLSATRFIAITMDQATKIRLDRKNSMLKLAELLDYTGIPLGR